MSQASREIPDDQALKGLAAEVGELLTKNRLKVTTAESCTGGLIAKVLTDTDGSSKWFELGLVTYSKATKKQLVEVTQQTLDLYTVVSAETVKEMVRGLLTLRPDDCAISVSGVAGPDEDSGSPSGTVWIAWGKKGYEPEAEVFHFPGGAGKRDAIRRLAAKEALQGLQKRLQSGGWSGSAVQTVDSLVQKLAAQLLARRQKLAIVESCTGGLIAQLCTGVAGSSKWFERGLVTYSNQAKQELLGVPAEILQRTGAVSAETVQAMVQGLLERAPVQWAIAVSGIAGPDGGTADKPVGTVWIAWAGSGVAASCSRFLFTGDRDTVRRLSAQAALEGLLQLL
jgi:nicotinamide-nucleotide amidase